MNLAFLCGGEVFGIVTTHGGWVGGWRLPEGSSTTGDDRSGKQIWLWRAHHPSPSLARSLALSFLLLLFFSFFCLFVLGFALHVNGDRLDRSFVPNSLTGPHVTQQPANPHNNNRIR
jgi:hypothetical protein